MAMWNISANAATELGTRRKMATDRTQPEAAREGGSLRTVLRSSAGTRQPSNAANAAPRAQAGRVPSRNVSTLTGIPTPSGAKGAARGSRARAVPEPENPVVTFLAEIDLLQYAEALMANGFDDFETLLEIEDTDLADLGMPRGHVIRLRKRLRQFAVAQPDMHHQLVAQVPTPMRADFGQEVARPTEHMASAVQLSWEKIRIVGSDTVGLLLYQNLFKIAPEAKALFPREVRARYAHWTMDEGEVDGDLNNSPALAALFGKTVDAVGNSVAGMHDMEALVPRLRQLGMRHIGYAGGALSEVHWAMLQKAFKPTLQHFLGELYTPEVDFAWSMVYNFISAIMMEGLREAREIAAKAQGTARMAGRWSVNIHSDGASTAEESSPSEA